jgi:hypothetical protein
VSIRVERSISSLRRIVQEICYEEDSCSTQSPAFGEAASDLCVRCDEELIAPDKSDYGDGTQIHHLWHCPKCSAHFESIEQPTGTELRPLRSPILRS